MGKHGILDMVQRPWSCWLGSTILEAFSKQNDSMFLAQHRFKAGNPLLKSMPEEDMTEGQRL